LQKKFWLAMLRQNFFKLPEVAEEIKVVTYVAGEGDISTDLLSPGNQAHSRSDRELHGKCLISPEARTKFKLYRHSTLIKVLC
jgi:aconitate hydratase 2/2-methylisocitrate dehydratase